MNEPLIRVVKKAELAGKEVLVLRLEAIILAIIAGGLFILAIGYNPLLIYKAIIEWNKITTHISSSWPEALVLDFGR